LPNAQPEGDVVRQKLSWDSLSVGDYTIKEILGEGSFSWVFRAVHTDGFTSKAIKVAKPLEAVAEGGPTSCIPTNAVVAKGGAVVELSPDTEQLLMLQARKLQAISDPQLISIEEISARPGGSYYRMPVLTGGHTLRQYMSAGPVAIDVLLDIALCMDRLLEDTQFGYHGDLKPENIMVTPSGMVLIDPGYFGTLDTFKSGAKQALTNCAVTTPIYYPMLEPDDLLALGLIMWEIACRDHPLGRRAYSGDFDRRSVGEELWNLVKSQETQGKYFLSAVLGLRRPSLVRPGMPSEIEELLLKALRLSFLPDGTLNLTEGFKNFAEFAAAIARLLSKNIRYL
jgi:serine/threonine protein kinase